MPRKEFVGGAPRTTLAADINNVTLTLTLASGTGYPAGGVNSFVLVIDRGLSTEEKVLCTSRSGTSVTVSASGRGYDGTTASNHSSGAFVEHVLDALTVDDHDGHVYTTSRDDHTQYLLATTAAGDGLGVAGRVLSVNVDAATTEVVADTVRVKDAGITTAKLANLGVTTEKIADLNVTTGKIADLAVTTAKIADLNVTTAKVADAAVTTAKIADANVTRAKLASNIPRGIIALSEFTSTTGTFGPTVIDFMTVTFTAETGRFYKIEFNTPAFINTNAAENSLLFELTDNLNNRLKLVAVTTGPVGTDLGYGHANLVFRRNTFSGSNTLKIRARAKLSSFNAGADTNNRYELVVEDLGT